MCNLNEIATSNSLGKNGQEEDHQGREIREGGGGGEAEELLS